MNCKLYIRNAFLLQYQFIHLLSNLEIFWCSSGVSDFEYFLLFCLTIRYNVCIYCIVFNEYLREHLIFMNQLLLNVGVAEWSGWSGWCDDCNLKSTWWSFPNAELCWGVRMGMCWFGWAATSNCFHMYLRWTCAVSNTALETLGKRVPFSLKHTHCL